VTPRLWGWVGLLTVAVAYELWGITDRRPGDTFSELVAYSFRTTTRVGATAFIVTSLLISAFFLPHIVINQGHWRRPPAVSSSKEH